jgi:hypothetical protein
VIPITEAFSGFPVDNLQNYQDNRDRMNNKFGHNKERHNAMNMKIYSAILLIMVLAATVTRGEAHITSGKITSIVVNDLGNPTGLDGANKRYAVTVSLDSEPDRLMGLSPTSAGQLTDIQKAMIELLKEAFKNEWKVAIRWESPVKTYAPILSVTVAKN